MPDKFNSRFRIPSARARWHDYNHGIYFVTICTAGKEHYFGKIENSEILLSETGKFITENIEQIDKHYPYCEIPLFVVMPNHIHLIVIIDNGVTQPRRDVARSRDVAHCRDVARNVSTEEQKNEKMSSISPKQGSLASVIRGLKSATTKFANTNHIQFAWQTRYHDHIIRSQEECNRIAKYIENNVMLWNTDCFNS